jgi:TonB family protein
MAARNKPFEQFGSYILFKKLESDSLGDLWRAGRVDGSQIGATVALRRLGGGNRAALTASVEAAARILPQLTGTSFARDQVAAVIDGVPVLAWDYAGGRSLRHLVDRARGSKDVSPNPLPMDQAIVIAEKVALSLATTAELRDGSSGRLSHGALLPQFIWISDDGEIRVAGQQLAGGIVASLADPKVAAEIGRYFAPELRTSGTTPKNADVYAMGAILFLLVTGQEPPDAMTASAFVSAVRAAKTTTGSPIPDDIRIILDKSFNLDPSMRYATMADLKQAISALSHSGRYSATTFNLAFYLSNLLKKEMEAETLERDKEAKLNLAPYLEAPRPEPVVAPAGATAAPVAPAAPMFGVQEPPSKSKLPVAIAAAVVLIAAGVGAWWFVGRNSDADAMPTTTANAQMLKPAAPAPAQPLIPEPIVATTATTSTVATTSADPEAQQKAFEDAVRAKLQAEMMKLQNDYMAELKKQQSKNAPVAAAPVVPAPQQVVEERAAPSAAQLDQQRREAARQQEESRPAAPVTPVQTQSAAPAVAQQQQPSVPAPAPVQQAATVREGDVVDIGSLDTLPRPTRPINAVYPPIARQQRISATVVVSALIDENGVVQQVKILKGVGRFGLDEAASRALKTARFSPPTKDGKRVKTWYPQTIAFAP